MKKKRFFVILAIVGLFVIVTAGITLAADDGPIFTRNISRTPETMTGASQMSVMSLYVPAQNTLGEPPDTDTGELEYYIDEADDCTYGDPASCTLAYTRPEARPIFVTYNDGIVLDEEALGLDAGIMTGAGFGERNAFAALSLDDGATWKNWDLSDSADRSSFVLQNGHEYPGDVFKVMHAVEGNKIVVAYISRYCESGAPLYSWLDEEKTGLLEAYSELVHEVDVEGGTDEDGYQLYADDLFTVGGTQKSVDYTLQGFPEVGEIPYGCVWAARGTLDQVVCEEDDTDCQEINTNGDPIYDITWRASERLTSGRRDANRIDITSAPGVGFIISWQEDPEGLRPGKGLGPGEGWSGAVANSKTDIWYTYIDWDHFDDVCLDDPTEDVYCDPGTLDEFVATDLFGQKPKIAVPFAMPLRLTDNSQCKYPQKLDTNDELLNPYCYADFDDSGAADFCATTELWTNPGGQTLEICVTEDGRHMTGRTASTRIRWAMKPFTNTADEVSAWVLMGEEKMKALGTEMEYPDTGADCPPNSDGTYPEECVPVDIGKNMWYHTFEWNNPELVAQGLMLNAPATIPFTEDFFEVNTDEWGNEFYDTEIARRFNLFVNSPAAAMASTSKTMGFLIYKEGILFQGGPADIFIRRLVLPDTFDPAVDNPFAYENVQCVEFADDGTATPVDLLYTDGENPNYVRGLCPESGMNLSSTSIVECDEGLTAADTCAEEFPFSLSYEEWASDDDDTQLPKVTEWLQTPDNFNDASWDNPYDVSKGHRGFIDGDFVMMMYATAPNWKAGTVGNEAYNLYIRRSFDGGVTWTTLPASFAHINGVTYSGDGTTTCEDYGWGGNVEEEFCTDYGPGEFEQARNVSRLTGSKVTVLDPRYSPSGGMLKKDYTNLLCDDDLDGIWESCGYTEAPYLEDIRDPSTFFATFETGDNTVVDVETGANPLNMYYSQATNFGDDWDAQDVCDTLVEDPWYPSTSAVCDEDEVDLRWDWLENGDDWATEASVYGTPDGSKFYAVWNQELPVDVEHDIYTDMDTEFRRIFYNLYLDSDPSAAIIYVSHTMPQYGEELVLLGSAWDNDHIDGIPYEDIAEVVWTDTFNGVTTVIDDGDNEPKRLNYPVRNLQPGWHQMGFKASDKSGRWSPGATVDILVTEVRHDIFMPSLINP